MTTQSEALKFGPQWIRKLSDCTLPSQRTAKSPVNTTHETASNTSADVCGTKCVHPFSDKRVRQPNEGIDHVGSNVWNPLLASNFDAGDRTDAVSHRPTRTKEDNSKLSQSRGLQFCSPHTELSSNNSGFNSFSPDASRLTQNKTTGENALDWSPRVSNFSASDRNWRRRPISTSTQEPIQLSSGGTKWKTPSAVSQSAAGGRDNPALNAAAGYAPHASDAPESSNPGKSNGTHNNSPEQESSHQSTVPEKSVTSGASSQEREAGIQSPQQEESSLVTPASTNLGIQLTKRAVSAYYGIQSTSQKRSSEADPVTNALWEQQQHLWSKSVPHRLHGLEPGSNDAISSTLSGILGQNMNVNVSTSSSVPNTDRFEGFDGTLASINPSAVTDPAASFQLNTTREVNAPEVYSTLDESRGFHRPDGADCPDEHMWLYEDPQGRTQGTFSDAQMHEWLLAGIYFTPTLRIRRKCDDTFSTLADYTRLFGRVPFVPSFRIPPIRGGITTQLLNLAAAKPGHLPSTDASATSEALHSTGSIDPRTGSGVATAGLPLSTAFHPSTSSTTLSFTGALESAATSNVGRLLISNLPSHRPAFTNRPDLPEYAGQIGAVHLIPNSSVGETRSVTHLKTSGGMCANSSLPVLQNRNPNGPISLLTHSLGGLNLTGVLSTTEGESPLNSSSSHSQSITSDSTLMTLASLISMSPALASLAPPFAGQSVTSNNSNTDFAAGAAAAISPGFLTALAQYLNVQPHNSGHQSVSPMQQLAETAQLAAQLAAMVGAHSPDQTPMQPAQALALAQLVMSQATSSLSEPPWATLSKRDVAATDQAQDAGVANSLNRHVDKDSSDDLMRSRMHLTHDPAGILTTGDESCLESQSPWSVGFGITGTSNRVSPRAVEGRAPGKSASDSLTRNESGAERPREGTLRSGGTVFSTSRSQAKGQSKVGSQRSPTSLTSSKAPNGFPSSSTRDTVKSSCSTEGMTHNTMVQNSTTTANPVWPWPVESDMADGKRKADQVVSGDRDAGQKSSPSQKNPTNQWINKIKQTPAKSDAVVGARGTSGNSDTRATNSSPLVSGKRSNRAVTSQSKPAPQTVSTNGTVLFPPKVTGTTPTNKNKVAHARNTTVSTTATSVAPQFMPSRVANSVVSDPEATADHELEQLIQWCQTRLGSLPMREKVDIPTVVELLATLDAPYEVERMVQTFLGESARTSQFVKDFLDHRRPFWQLHRERRERESQIKSGSKSQSGGNHAQSNGPRAAEKKKKSHAQEGTGRVNSSTGCNGGLGWHKVGSSTSDNHTDPTQDNEWHHIKPKSNHNRRGKKDKAS